MIDKFEGTYRFLSNFFLAPVIYEGVTYPSSEHAYQAAKTEDAQAKEAIQLAPTPSKAKRLGRRVEIQQDWILIRERVMYHILQEKFKNPYLKAQLLATGDQELVEGNWWGDVFWGVCNGEGMNKLGKLLMKVRQEILDSETE